MTPPTCLRHGAIKSCGSNSTPLRVVTTPSPRSTRDLYRRGGLTAELIAWEHPRVIDRAGSPAPDATGARTLRSHHALVERWGPAAENPVAVRRGDSRGRPAPR